MMNRRERRAAAVRERHERRAGAPTALGATFFCRLNYVQVQSDLGRGEEFSEGFFATNDRRTIASLVHPNLRVPMGSLEYDHFLESPLVAYCKIPNLAAGAEKKKVFERLMLLDAFENAFWLHGDSCVGHELAFIVNGHKIHSNLYQGMRTRSDGTSATVTLSGDDFRELVQFFRSLMHPRLDLPPARFHTKGNSSRFSRALALIGRAQKTAFLSEKITFYCSALEALFSTSQAELAHQIAERVALISSLDAQARMQKYRFLKDCYSFRSKYIHGSPLKDLKEAEIAERSTRLDAAVRDAVEVALKDQTLGMALGDETALDNYMLEKIFT
jgi:hypothetical protein